MKGAQLGFTGFVVLAMLFAGSVLYRHAKTFTAGSVLPAVAERAVAFFPQVSQSVAEVSGRVMPIYVEELQRQAPQFMPLITKVADRELSAFFVRLEADTHRYFSEMAHQLAQQEQSKLRQDVPAFRDAEHSDILMHNLYTVLHESFLLVLLEKFQAHLEPVHAFQQTVDEYRRELAGQYEADVEVKLLATGLELAGKRLAQEIE